MREAFMTALRIPHVRHLKNIRIPLSATQRKNLILTGKNGSGKTSVLEKLKYFFSNAVDISFRTEEELISNILLLERQLETDNYSTASFNYRKELRALKEQLALWRDGAIADYNSFSAFREKYHTGQYILAYYSDNREMNVDISENIEKVNLQEIYSIDEHPSQQLVKYLVNLKTTQAFAQTSGNAQRAIEIKKWFYRFENILRTIYDDNSLVLHFDIETFQFTIQMDNREPFDFNSMSMGYAAVFDIIGDLMMRMEKQCTTISDHPRTRPIKKLRSYDLEGLILIDEIETHLHVDLQKKIMPILTELFPNLQFVLTTHSPFILNSTPNAVVYDLEKKLLVSDGLNNLPYDGIVEGYFGADQLSQELRKKFEEYKSIVQKPDLTDADFARAAELEMYLDEVPDYLALDMDTEYKRLKLELSNRG